MPQKPRDPYNRSRNHREGKKKQFLWFSMGSFHGLSPKSNEEESSQKWNEGWILLGIKWGLE